MSNPCFRGGRVLVAPGSRGCLCASGSPKSCQRPLLTAGAAPLLLFCSAESPGGENASANDAGAQMDVKVKCFTGEAATASRGQGCEKCEIAGQMLQDS